MLKMGAIMVVLFVYDDDDNPLRSRGAIVEIIEEGVGGDCVGSSECSDRCLFCGGPCWNLT